jgi:hypothetical protein
MNVLYVLEHVETQHAVERFAGEWDQLLLEIDHSIDALAVPDPAILGPGSQVPFQMTGIRADIKDSAR